MGADTKIIAFGHRTGVGKDTAAKMLISEMRLSGKYPRGVKKVSFAKPLKDAAYVIWKCYGIKPGDYYEDNWKEKDTVLRTVNMTPRGLWIELGQKVRSIYGDSWRDAALGEGQDCDALIITDLRFINEANGVHERNGLCICVESNRTDVWNKSDFELKNWTGFDDLLNNNGTLSELHENVMQLAARKGIL